MFNDDDKTPQNLPVESEVKDMFDDDTSADETPEDVTEDVAQDDGMENSQAAAPSAKVVQRGDRTSGGVRMVGGSMQNAPSALDAGKLQPKTVSMSQTPTPSGAMAPGAPYQEPANIQESFIMRHKLIVGLVLFVIIGLIVAVGITLFARSGSPAERTDQIPPPAIDVVEQPLVVPVPEEVVPEAVSPIVEATSTPLLEETTASSTVDVVENDDPDGDGLSTTKELLAGTDPQKSDTDDDRLTDKEELNIWKTDPLDADSDDDTFSDGDEVRHGFNPLGPGKLFTVPKQ